MIDGSTSGSEIQQLKNNNPDATILNFDNGRYFDPVTKNAYSDNLMLSGNSEVYLVGQYTDGLFGEKDATDIPDIVAGLEGISSGKLNFTHINLIANHASDGSPDSDMVSEVQKKYPDIAIQKYSIAEKFIDSQNISQLDTLISKIDPINGDGGMILNDLINSLKENPKLFHDVNHIVEKYIVDVTDISNRYMGKTLPFMQYMKAARGYRNDIEKKITELVGKYAGMFAGEGESSLPLALVMSNNKPSLLTSFVAFLTGLDEPKVFTKTLNDLAVDISPKYKKNKDEFFAFKKIVDRESSLSTHQLRQITDYAASLLDNGPLVIGEQHSKKFGKSLINYLINSGVVKKLFLEQSDVALYTDEDLNDLDSTMEDISEDIFLSGEKTFSDYFNKINLLDDSNKEKKKHIDEYLDGIDYNFKNMLYNAKMKGVAIYFVDDPSMRLDIARTHDENPEKFISGIDARNRYMADAYKSIIGQSDGVGSILLVGSGHLYDSPTEKIKGVWEYMGISSHQTLDTMDINKNFNSELSPDVVREKTVLYPGSPVIKNEYPDDESASIHAYPGTALYIKMHPEYKEQNSSVVHSDGSDYQSRIIVTIGESDTATGSIVTALVAKFPEAKILWYIDGSYYEKPTATDGQSADFSTVGSLDVSGNVNVEFVGHGSATSLGNLDVTGLDKAVGDLVSLLGEKVTIQQLSLVGCDTGSMGPGKSLSDSIKQSFPNIDIKGYQGTIKIDSSGAVGGLSLGPQQLLSHENLLISVARTLSDLVSPYRNMGANVRFAPQSFLLGDDAERGICTSLSQAWLFALSQGDGGKLASTLLDDIFLYSQGLVDDASAQGRLPGELSQQVSDFLNILSGVPLPTADGSQRQSLSDIIQTLSRGTDDKFFSLQAGNHLMAIARDTRNGQVFLRFYDPNAAVVEIPVGTDAAASARALGSIIQGYLGSPVNGGTLADFYHMVQPDGALQFTVSVFSPSEAAAQPGMQSLLTRLQKDMTASPAGEHHTVTPPVIQGNLLPEPVETLRQNLAEVLKSFQAHQQNVNIQLDADAKARLLLDHILTSVSADAGAGAEGHLNITGLTVLPEDAAHEGKIVLDVVYRNLTDGSTDHHVSVVLDPQDFVPDDGAGAGHTAGQSADEQAYQQGFSVLGKAQNIYTLLTSVTGLINSIGQGNTQGEAINGTFLTMSVTDITGLTDKLADRLGQAIGLGDGGGLSGLLGGMAGKLAGLAGLGEEAAAAVGKFVAEVPVLNFAMVGYSVYSDVQNLENTTDEDARNRAIGTLTVDTITGAITVAASVAGMLGAISSDAAGSIGGVVAGVGIMIDVMINPWDPMGFRSLINPDSIKLGNDIEQEGLLWTNHTDGLYVVRPSAGSTGGYLSFILTPGDLSDVRNFLNNPLSTTVLNAISEDIKGMSADELKSYAADYHQSTEDTIYNLRLLFSASDNPSPSDADMNNLLQQFWKALDVLNEQTWISNDNNLLYLVNHDTPLPVSAHNGDMQVILDEDGQGFTLGWTTAPQDIKNVERMTSNEDGAVGPEIMAPRHVSLAQGSNDILMGSGQADTIHFYDPADTYAQQDLTLDPWTESSSFDSGINTYSYGRTNDQGWDMTHAQAGVDSTSASFHLVPYKRQFTVTGNSADNKFYSAYNDPEQRYDYIVSGGGGDDTLLMSQYGYYNFEGGANGEKGDWVVAPQAAGSDGSYILYDLESAGSPVQTAGLTMRINFGLTLSDVENIQGNAGNELFHGSAGKNIIVTGGGNDVVWLSGGGDTYQASLNGPTPTTLVIHGQTGRDAAATRDGVIFDSPLSSLYFSQSPSPDGAICTVSYAANSVQLVDGAADQVVFGISKNLSVYFHSDGKTAGLIALLQTGDVGTLKTLKLSPVPGAIDPDARSLTLPTGEVINLGFGLGFSIMVPDSESGHRLLLQYAPDSQGNLVVSQATVFLSDNEHLLTVNLDTLRRQRDNLGVPVEFISPDGVSFRLKEITDSVTGKVSHTLIIDNFGSSDDTIAGKMSGWADQQGIDTLVADLNSLKSGSNPIVVDPEFVETSIFKINGGGILLDVGSLQALQPAPGGSENGLLGITLQDNTTLSFSDTTQWDHLVLLVSDTFGNQTEVDYAADGSVSRYITQLPWGFSAVDVSALNALSAGLSSPMKWVTKDGISFHFADSKGADGKMLRSMIIDNLDPGTWPDAVKGHSGESPLSATGILTPPAGVTRVVLDIDVLRARCLPGESLVLGLGNSGDTVLRVSVNSTDLAQLSHSLPVHFESGDRLTLPDGTFIFTDGINWGHVTLLIHAQDTGLDWMLNYTDGGANATPALVKILSSDPLNPDGLLNGNVTHKLTGSESQHYTSDITVSPADSLTLEGDDRDNNITGATNNQNTLLGDAGNDTLTGGSQDDWFVGGAGADHMIGGTGSDTVQFTGDTSSQEGVLVNLSEAVQKGGEAEGDRLEGIENIVGSGYDDTLYGDTGNNALYGGAGNDTLGGLGGTDLLAGGQGADTYRIASGDQVVISQADNGTATDILNFEGVETDRLNFVLSGDDLVISGDDRVAVLKDWNKGDNHYTLSGMDAAQFSQRVASGLAVPSTLKDLAALYQSLNDQNRLNAKEQVAEQNKGTEASGSALMSMSGWHVSKGNTSGLMTGGQDSTVGLNGPVTADEQTAESFSADADYRLEMDVQASPMGIQGLHVRLKVGDTILAEGVGSSGVVQPDGLTYHLELTADGALGVQDADGKTPLVLEVEEDKDAGGVIIEHAQLLKLTGAMASFGGGAGGGVSSPGVVVPTGGVPPVITAGL
jgi:Ca2+-binding RTX toxin-like protein